MRKALQKFLEFSFLQTVGVLAFSAYASLCFGFNILSRAHWRYFFDMQLDGAPVALGFYAALIGFIVYSVAVVWFVLVRPRRRIVFDRPGMNYIPLGAAVPEPAPSPVLDIKPVRMAAAQPVLQRPPRMSPGFSAAPAYQPAAPVQPFVPSYQPVLSPTPAPANEDSKIESNSLSEVIEIMKSAGFIMGKAPKIAGVKIDVWALDGDELYIGIVHGAHGRITAREGGRSVWSSDIDGEFKSPVAEIYSVIESLQALFAETLDAGMSIKINAFVLCPDGNIENYEKLLEIWKAFGVSVMNHGVPELAAWAREIPMQPKNESFEEYMNTVVWYYEGGDKK
ncbi:MAG: hypothetical protein LBH81_00225 [Rickettsiales bacterium]|jgi:hypothetical protein|nr:hypothetical protein [Rickettsiales bacterium]